MPLAARHDAAVAPLRIGRHTAAVWPAATVYPRATPAALAGSLTIVARRGRDRESRVALARLIETARILRGARSPTDAVVLPALHGLDHAAYSFGFWREALRRHDLSALLPAGA